jgi:DNA-binding transcriptional ArsR family regulator
VVHAARARVTGVGDEIDETLLALADPTRRAVVDLLREGPRRAGALAQALSLTPPAMSRHLRVLRKARVVEEQALEADARVRVYRLRAEPLQALRSWVEEVSAFWGEQLAAFKEHAEGTAAQAPADAPGRRVASTPVAGKPAAGKPVAVEPKRRKR